MTAIKINFKGALPDTVLRTKMERFRVVISASNNAIIKIPTLIFTLNVTQNSMSCQSKEM